ncbi:MAG: hypothetical protein ACR2GY_00115 [Phycisphaerales bacterium]
MTAFARQFNDTLPRPGLIHTIGNVPGTGAEDLSQNTTANLYSSIIAQHYLTPQLVISPLENSEKVVADENYDHTAYSPANDVYWDASFAADLATVSNVSYAHIPLVGEWAAKEWRVTGNSNVVLLGDRGPEDGIANPASVTCTNKRALWKGAVLFADGHSEFWNSFDGSDTRQQPFDKIFAPGDNLISFTKSIIDGKAQLQWD